MVATRSGVRVSASNTEINEHAVIMEATPATPRMRRKTVREEHQSQLTSESHHKGGEEGSTSTSSEMKTSTVKRKPRSSKRHVFVEDHPDSMHEADVSESESCCSVVSDLQDTADVEGTRRRGRGALALPKPSTEKDQDVLSEAESGCSSASAQRGTSTRRSTRSRQRSLPAEDQPTKSANATNENSEAESCSSAVSGTKMLTRSQKRITLSRASSKSRTEDTELSEVDSCSSGLSGLRQTALRRSAQSRRSAVVQLVPMNLEENTDGSPLPRRQTRSSRAKPELVGEPQSHDSDGFESGPSSTPRRATRSQAASAQQGPVILSDSESEATSIYGPLGSPISIRGKGTPCSSRTGSGSSVRATSVTQITEKPLNVLKEQDDCDAPDSSALLLSEQPESPEEKVESEMADVSFDASDQSGTVTVTETAEAKEKEVVAMVVDSLVSPDCSLIEEVSEQDKTLIADQGECVSAVTVTMEDEVEPQVVQEVTLVKVTICGSTDEEVNKEEKTMGGDVRVAQDCTLMQENQESERHTSKVIITPGMLGVKTAQDEQHHVVDVIPPSPADKVIVSEEDVVPPSPAGKVIVSVEDVVPPSPAGKVIVSVEYVVPPSPAFKVVVSDAALSKEKKVDDSAMEIDLTACQQLQGVCEEDHSTAEEGVSVSMGIAGSTQKADDSLILLESSDEEGEDGHGGHSDRESRDGEDREGSDSEEEIICPDENLAGPSKAQAASPLMSNDGLFVIDTLPGFHSEEKYYIDQEKMIEDEAVVGEEPNDLEDEEDEEFVDEEGDEDDDADDFILFKSKSKDPIQLSTSIDPGLKVKDIGGLYISVDGSKSKGAPNAMKKLKEQKNQDGLMQRSVIGPDFEKKESVPPYNESKYAMKLKRKEEREKSTGDGWFNMKAPEMTEELTNDLKVLKMRAAMDPKRFYKKNDRDGFPKYFQVGTVVDSPADFYNSRVPKKQRKRTMVEELLADAEFRNYNKKKFKQIMAEKAALSAGKKYRKKNKFQKKQNI